MNANTLKVCGSIVGLLASTPALGHAPEAIGHSLLSGLAHPLHGADHLLAVAGLGLWLGWRAPRFAQAWVPVLVLALALGIAVGMTGVALPALETALAASVVMAGLLLISRTAFRQAYGAALTALVVLAFGLLHGNAHGLEMPAGATLFPVGLLLGTAALQATATLVGGRWLGGVHATRLTGWMLAGAGLAALAGTGA